MLWQSTVAAPNYPLFALPGDSPRRPGLVRISESAASIEVEVYQVPREHVGSFLEGIAEPLGLGKLELENGQWVAGFICELWGLEGARDVSAFGGWRAYIESIN